MIKGGDRMNLPNKLTVLRMIMVPFFVVFLTVSAIPHHYLIAFVLFSAASYTDHLDGKIARKRKLITNFGKFMDPLADKILVVSALVCFLQMGLTNVWFVLIVIAREFMVTSIRLVAADSGIVIAANRWGKAKTVSQIVAILVVIALQYLRELLWAGSAVHEVWCYLIGEAFLLICVLLTVVSGVIYLKQNWKVFRDSK